MNTELQQKEEKVHIDIYYNYLNLKKFNPCKERWELRLLDQDSSISYKNHVDKGWILSVLRMLILYESIP